MGLSNVHLALHTFGYDWLQIHLTDTSLWWLTLSAFHDNSIDTCLCLTFVAITWNWWIGIFCNSGCTETFCNEYGCHIISENASFARTLNCIELAFQCELNAVWQVLWEGRNLGDVRPCNTRVFHSDCYWYCTGTLSKIFMQNWYYGRSVDGCHYILGLHKHKR